MSRNKKGKNIYRSMVEFERKYLPKSLEKRRAEKPTDAQALGASLAKETLEKIKGKLVEIDST